MLGGVGWLPWAIHLARRRLFSFVIALIMLGLAVWFQRWSLDGLQGVALSALLHQDTAYADGYTNRAFRMVRAGMTEERIRSLLGPPLGVTWSYRVTRPKGCTLVHFRNGRTRSWVFDECEKLGIRMGLPIADADTLLGPPDETYWLYSESPSDTHYRVRVIRFSQSQVVGITKGWYLD